MNEANKELKLGVSSCNVQCVRSALRDGAHAEILGSYPVYEILKRCSAKDGMQIAQLALENGATCARKPDGIILALALLRSHPGLIYALVKKVLFAT